MQTVLLYLTLLFSTSTLHSQINTEAPLVKMNFKKTCDKVIIDQRMSTLPKATDTSNNVITFNSRSFYSID
jgi:hypothetical protein